MKFWQKLYLSTLILFVLFFFSAMFAICWKIYDKNLNEEKEAVLNQHLMIMSAMSKDFYALEERNVLNDETIQAVFDDYKSLYRNDGVFFELYYNQRVLGEFPLADELREELAVEDGTRKHLVRYMDNQKLMYVAGRMSSPFERFTFVMTSDITRADDMLQMIKQIARMAGIIVSILLALILLPFFKRLTNSITNLSKATDQVLAGNYDIHIPHRTNDEIGDLGRKFNIMTQEIKDKIETIISEAESKQIFTDNLAHELRTPLTAIHGYAELMQKTKITEEDQYIFLNYILSESTRLKSMSSQLLELSVMKKKNIPMQLINTIEIKEKLLLSLKVELTKKQISLFFDLKSDSLTGNEDLIYVLIQNLVMNAIRACDNQGRILVEIEILETTQHVKVTDSGSGISKENLCHVTEPFYRVDKVRSRKDGGAGLGLALCKQIMELHHGKLIFSSREGIGTSVRALWPLNLKEREVNE